MRTNDSQPGHDFARIALRRAEINPHATAFRFVHFSGSGDELVTYESLISNFAGISKVMATEVPVGARAVLIYEHGAAFIYALLACFWSRIIAVPMPPPRGGLRDEYVERLRRVLVDSGAKIVLTTEAVATGIQQQMLGPGGHGVRIIATDLIEPACALNSPGDARSDAAIIQYSSGSSGEPRGVLISHGNLLSNSEAIKQAFRHDRDCVGVSWLPHFHDMGLVGGILQPLYVGFEVTLMAPSDFIQQPLRWLDAISRFRATTSGAPTFGYRYCCRRIRAGAAENICLNSWKVAFCGSEPVNAEVLRAFGEQFSVNGFSRNAFVPCYGLAEATLLVTSKLALESCIDQSSPIEKSDRSPSGELAVPGLLAQVQPIVGREIVNCGPPALDTSIIIASLDADGAAQSGVTGEICVSGPGVGTCYWRNPVESKSTFLNKFQKQVGRRYLRTGDIGFLIHGELHVTGRLKDTIKISGKTTHAIDIENEMERCNPCVHGGAGAAVARQTECGEELILVQEVVRPSEVKDLTLLARTISSRVVEKFGFRPSMVVLVRTPAIPRTTSGKVIRALCKDPLQCFKSNQILKLFNPQQLS